MQHGISPSANSRSPWIVSSFAAPSSGMKTPVSTGAKAISIAPTAAPSSTPYRLSSFSSSFSPLTSSSPWKMPDSVSETPPTPVEMQLEAFPIVSSTE